MGLKKIDEVAKLPHKVLHGGVPVFTVPGSSATTCSISRIQEESGCTVATSGAGQVPTLLLCSRIHVVETMSSKNKKH